jgi:hypothetical protein
VAVDEEADGEMAQQGPEPTDGAEQASTDEELTDELDLSGEAPSDRADVRREWFRVLIRFLGAEVHTGFGREWRGRHRGWSDRVFRMFAAGAFVLFAVFAALFTAMVMTEVVLGGTAGAGQSGFCGGQAGQSGNADGWRRLAVGAVSFLVVFGVALFAPRLVAKDNNER